MAHAIASATPATNATSTAAIGSAIRNTSRVSGITIRLTTTRTANIATKATSCVATTDIGTSCRGNRTFRISAALSRSERDAVVSDVEKKSHTVSPTSRYSA